MEADAKRRSRRTLVIVVAVALILAGAFAAWELLRSRTLAEVLAMAHWQAGSEVSIDGTIADIQRYETSYGPIVALGLDGGGVCALQGANPGGVLGDPNATYTVGERFRTTLHFTDYRFNGAKAVWAPELACPMPVMLEAVARVYDAVSGLGGILLAYNGTDAGGWASYVIVTPTADAFRPDVLPVTLRKATPFTSGTIDSGTRWTTVVALEYVLVSGQFFSNPIVDDMASLAAGTSRNGTLRYVDINGNGLADDGDRLDVHLPDPGAGNAYETYMVQIGEVGGRMAAYAYGGHYILNGPRGPIEPLPSAQEPLVELRYVGDRGGSPVTSDLQIARVRFGAPRPLSSLSFVLVVNGTGASGDFSRLPATGPGGVSITYTDANLNDLFDEGDGLAFGSLSNQTYVSFQLLDAGKTLAHQTWTTGYGHEIGRPPSFTLDPRGTSPTRVSVTVDYWHPELVLNRTVRASLRQNDTLVLANVSLVNGMPSAFAGGDVTFLDRDGDGYLSTGDEFVLQGTTGARYDLTVSIFGMPVRTAVFFG